MLLLKWLHHLSNAKWSLSNLASMLRLNLFTYRDLKKWLENPFGTPPLGAGSGTAYAEPGVRETIWTGQGRIFRAGS